MKKETKEKKKPLTSREIYALAIKETARRKDGTMSESDLEDNIVELLVLDIEEEKHRRARNIIDSHAKPGSTPPDGQLMLEGFDTYLYEPERLVRNAEGGVVEQEIAPLAYKQDEAVRAREHQREVAVWAERKTTEAELHARWVIEHMGENRSIRKLSFGTFIRETGRWNPESETDQKAGK